MPAEKKAPPRITILFTLLAKDGSLFTACQQERRRASGGQQQPLGRGAQLVHTGKSTGGRLLTKARFVRGPSASMDTMPGCSETLSTRNSDALFSVFCPLGVARGISPIPLEPWTKSATRGFPPCEGGRYSHHEQTKKKKKS